MNQNQPVLTRYEDFYSMLSDRVRMDAFEKAISSVVSPGDHVLDLGAGTGILGFLALRAGAERVYAIEKSDSINLAREVARKNGFLNSMEFFESSSLDVNLPRKADVLISETLGSFGIDENTLPFVDDAKKRLLVPGGKVLPSRLSIYLCPVESNAVFEKLSFWEKLRGIDFSSALQTFSKKMLVEELPIESLLSTPSLFSEIDFQSSFDVEQKAVLRFGMERAGTVHGFGGWFDLDLCGVSRVSTEPGAELTHWKQAFFPAWPPVEVVRGDILEIYLEVKGESEESDNTVISYEYRCTQLANEWKQQRVGRNDPCPCGSSQKFKKCCGRKL